MVSPESVEQQLKNIRFNSKGWGKGEIDELPNILMDEEKIFECANGYYEGGFAMLCATNLRLLLIDKKPLKFLTVEDLRFDMINQIDYSHRLFGAHINVSAGNKNLQFTSYNQKRLRKLINHIQHRMAEVKKEQSVSAETQQQHLERINQQLQAYLRAQHEQQEELRKKLEESQRQGQPTTASASFVEPVKPAPELADFLYAQSLMQQYESKSEPRLPDIAATMPATANSSDYISASPQSPSPSSSSLDTSTASLPDVSTEPVVDTDSLVAAGRKEIFGNLDKVRASIKPLHMPVSYHGIEVNPMRIAYAKLPLALRRRKFSHIAQSANLPKAPLMQQNTPPAPI